MADSSHLMAEVNMADVAQRAGVSLSTVSRALRGLPGVSAPTRDRVLMIVDDLSYVVSPEASRLARRETGRVAVVVPKIDVWFYAAMLSAIEATLHEAELDVLVYQVDGRDQRSRFFHELPARRKVDAVVLIALPLLEEEVQRLELLGVEVVVAGGRIRDLPHVLVDDHDAAAQAVNHLLDLGHTRVAMIRTTDTEGAAWSSDILRQRGYRDALASRGIPVPPGYLASHPAGVDAGDAAIGTLLELPEPPTAVFAYSDELAAGAVAAVLRRGLRVPEDVSVIGVDGNPLAAILGLTTVDQSVPRQGRLAGQMALSLLRRESPPRRVVVPCDVVVRRSTGPPPS
ncbi:MAG: LacI family DNA-binding transcriptional regulator [Nocardioides sp.]